MSAGAIRVIAEDLDAPGETMTRDVEPGDYCLIAVEPLHLDGITRYANGTVILTLKRSAT